MEVAIGAAVAAGCFAALFASAASFYRRRLAMPPEQRQIEDREILNDSAW